MSEHNLKRIIPVVFSTCQTCVFWQEPKQGAADCYGMPPSVHIIGASQDALGRPALQLETFVPKLKADRPACSLHRAKMSSYKMGIS
jgi:hypothetical protein